MFGGFRAATQVVEGDGRDKLRVSSRIPLPVGVRGDWVGGMDGSVELRRSISTVIIFREVGHCPLAYRQGP